MDRNFVAAQTNLQESQQLQQECDTANPAAGDPASGAQSAKWNKMAHDCAVPAHSLDH